MFCAPSCSLPNSLPLRLLTCEAPTGPILKCRRLSQRWQSPERRWCLANGVILRQISSLLQKPLLDVCSFLYELTLQKFGRILNPRCSQWNYYRVPFVRPDTCALYDGIFDMHGNLRNPLHPFIQRLLLLILEHFLNMPCDAEKESRNLAEDIIFGRRGNTCKDFFKAASTDQTANLRQFFDESTFGFGAGGGTDDGDDKDSKDGKDGDGRDGDGRDGDGRDSDGKGGSGSDGADGANKKKKGAGDDGDDEGDSSKSKNKKRRDNDRKSMKDISNLYSDVVEDRYARKLVNVKKVKKPKAKKRHFGDKRVMGVMLPVLMHEPFDEQKPWTWIRRHPHQVRVLEGTRLGRARVHRYKRQTLQQQFEKAKERSSVQSVYSTRSHQSIVSTDLFGNVNATKKGPMLKSFNYKQLTEKPMEQVSNISIRKPLKLLGKKGR